MRLGKHEKEILRLLNFWHDTKPGWEWSANSGYLSELADEANILAYENGRRVPIWMLKRDLQCGKTVLSRSLHTLAEKNLITLYGADLDTIWGPFTRYAKYVGLKILCKTETFQS